MLRAFTVAACGSNASAAGPGAGGGGRGGRGLMDRALDGLVVVGGLLFSQLVTLYLTPVVYTYMAQLQTWMKSRQKMGTLLPITAEEKQGPPRRRVS